MHYTASVINQGLLQLLFYRNSFFYAELTSVISWTAWLYQKTVLDLRAWFNITTQANGELKVEIPCQFLEDQLA